MKNSTFFLTTCITYLLVVHTFITQAQTWPPDGMNGDGNDATPWQITTAEQLGALASYVSAGNGNNTANQYYILINNIDLAGWVDPNCDTCGWKPIGDYNPNNNNSAFQGFFNGNDKIIHNLTINRSTNYVGLFGTLYYGAIENLKIENCNIIGDGHVGALAGRKVYTLVNNCSSTGIVSGNATVGGLVGSNVISTVINCYSSCNITAGSTAGGIVGTNTDGSTISNSYSTGNVSGGQFTGGLAGYNWFSSGIKNSFSTGKVNGLMNTGGITGQCTDSYIIDCYSTGQVSGTEDVGGIVGYISQSGSIRNCYATGRVSGSNYVAGIAGSCYMSVIVRNCIAANDTITASLSSANINRIVGYASMNVTCDKNYAINEMIMIRNGTVINPSDDNYYNGTREPRATFKTLVFYNTTSNWGYGPWDFSPVTGIWDICEDKTFPFFQWQGILVCPHIINASSGNNGTINPSGTVLVNDGANQTFTFTPATCYEIDQVLVNGTNNPAAVAAGSYTFSNVTEDHTISVTFKIKTYSITANAGANGTITPGTVTVNCGANQTFTFTPATCYEIDQVLVNGTNNPAAVAAGSYTFSNVTEDHTISVTFKIKTYSITATAGANGTITPGTVTVNCGANQTFTFTPATCYEIDQVLVNGTNNPTAVAAGSYTFENVTEDHTISVTFKIKTYSITATAGANGTITPGTVTVNCGANQTFTFTPTTCYEIDQVLVDGTNNPAAVTAGSYTFENITENHTIEVTFALNNYTYTVTATAGENGEINSNGGVIVNCGDNLTFTFSPNIGYNIHEVLIDGVNNEAAIAAGNYTFENITADHTIHVTFILIDGIDEHLFGSIKVYPNPTTSELKIENGELRIENVEIFDVYGQKQFSTFNFQLSSQKIDISHLQAGIYFVKISTNAGIVVKKVVKI